MKKILLIILLFLISCSEESKQENSGNAASEVKTERKIGRKKQPKNDLEKIGLKGKVRKLIKTEYAVLETNKEYTGEERLVFDEQGRIVRSIIKVPKQKLYIRTDKKYTSDKITETVRDGSGKILEIRETLLKDGKPLEKITKNSKGKLLYKETYFYNDNGNLIRQEFYKKNKLDYIMTSEYQNGRKSKQTKLTPKGDTVFTYSFQYDTVGNLIRSLQTVSGGKKYIELQYSYDEQGNLIKEIHINHASNTQRENVFSYDSLGNPTSKLQVFHLEKRRDSLITDYSYRYDDSGNWIQKIEQVNKVPSKVTERKIEY